MNKEGANNDICMWQFAHAIILIHIFSEVSNMQWNQRPFSYPLFCSKILKMITLSFTEMRIFPLQYHSPEEAKNTTKIRRLYFRYGSYRCTHNVSALRVNRQKRYSDFKNVFKMLFCTTFNMFSKQLFTKSFRI